MSSVQNQSVPFLKTVSFTSYPPLGRACYAGLTCISFVTFLQLFAGGVAGVTECLVMYPTDVLKTRAQLSTTKLTMADCTRQIIKNEGILTFYRGITAPLLAEAPKRAVKFSTNSIYKGWFTSRDGKLSNAGAGAAGKFP